MSKTVPGVLILVVLTLAGCSGNGEQAGKGAENRSEARAAILKDDARQTKANAERMSSRLEQSIASGGDLSLD